MMDPRPSVPLCIDCDGTLLRTDILHEMVFRLLKVAPWRLLWLPLWLVRGKAFLKQFSHKLILGTDRFAPSHPVPPILAWVRSAGLDAAELAAIENDNLERILGPAS